MKKGFIFTAGLALVLSCGVAVGAHQAKSVNEARADSKVNLYLDISGLSWWSSDDAEIHAHCFDGSVDPTTWPGAEMSLVAGSSTVYSVEVDSSYTHVIFTRVNPSNGEVWNRTSKDPGTPINLPADYSLNDKWNLTASDYDDGNYTGSWSKYAAPFDPTTQHYYKVGDGEWSIMVNDGTFTYDENKTGYRYRTNGVSASSGDVIQFKAGEDIIHPGASSPAAQGGGENNLIANASTVKVLNGYTGSLLIYRYEDGYDSFFGGYTPNVQTFYFTNNRKWEGTPKYYVFDALDNSKAIWPGEDMTFVDVDGDENSRYSFTVDTNRYSSVVINNGADGEAKDQTNDYAFADFEENGAYISGGDKAARELGFFHYTPAIYSLQVGVSSYTLEKSTETQYVAHDVDLTAGASVYYYYDGVDPTGVTAKAVYNNNLSSELKVVSTAEDVDVYVDVAAKTIWAEGLPTLSSGFHLYVNTTVHPLATRVNEYSQTEYYSTLLTFAADDEIRFIHIQDDAAPVIFGDAAVEGGEQAANFEYESEIGCIVAQNTCSSALYFKPGTPNNVWFADVSQELKEAREFAQGFNTSLGSVCNAGGSSDKDALYTAWEAQKTAFLALDDGDGSPQDILKKATASHDVEDIAKFIAKYEYIAAKYGSYFASKDASYNFLGEGHVPASLYGGPVDNNNSVPTASIIAIVSVVSVLSISAIIVLVAVKKRKHN